MVTYPQGWETYRVIDVADFFDNLRIPVTKNQRRHGNTPYYGANGIQDYVDGYTHDGEFVLIAEDGANDLLNYPVTYAKGKIWVNNHAHVISAKESVAVTKFLYYLLKKVDYTTFLVGGTRAKLNGKTFKNIEITIPSNTSEQKAISSILSDLDNHIDNLGKLIEKKKNIRDGALEDLTSGRTRLDGFDDEWVVYPFNQYFTLLPTNTYPREQLSNRGEVGNIHYGDVLIRYGNVLSDEDEIPRLKDASKISERSYLQMNDVLIADTAEDETVGKAVQVGKVSIPLVGGLHTVACRPNYETANGFLGYYMNSSHYHDQLYPYITGIKVSSVSKKSFGETYLRIPADLNEQSAIVSVLTEMDNEIKNLEAERDKMIQIREGAMDDLLTGRVRLTM